MKKCIFTIIALILLSFTGCKLLETVTNVTTEAAARTGVISHGQKDSIQKVGSATGKALEKYTPEQEYYLGRTLAATLLTDRKPYYNDAVNKYLNVLGQSLAMYSDKPETFKGYRFIAMETDEVNAFATPGGFILVSRGLIRCCKTEDELAAVLAHEIGHIQLEHGIKAIGKSRLIDLGKVIISEGAKNYSATKALAQKTAIFGGAIGDMTSKIANTGYAKTQEYQADEVAVTILQRAGYNSAALKSMLEKMDKQIAGKKKHGFGKTHPEPKDRIKKISPSISDTSAKTSSTRQARFNKAMHGI